MGICFKKNKEIRANSIKNQTSNNDNNFNKNYTFLKYLKSIKNLSDINNRLSKLTKYEDINKYYILSTKKIIESEDYVLYPAKRIDSQKKDFNFIIKQNLKSKKDDQINISLIKEIKINNLLHHENIAKCYDIFEDDLSVYFVYEYLPMGTLYNYILKKRKQHLKDKKIISILEQIFFALAYLHEKIKIIHRDIKPTNFLVKKEGKKIIVKLKNFEEAEFIKEEGFNYLLKGTPVYIAPEVYLEQSYDSKIDMWATGITLYNMITGCNPFKLSKSYDLLKNTKNKKEDLNITRTADDKIIMQRVLNQEIDFMTIKHLGLRQLTQHLLERNPQKRISALEALEELNKIKLGINLCVSKTIKESENLKRIPTVIDNNFEESKKDNKIKKDIKLKNDILNRNQTLNNLGHKYDNNVNTDEKEDGLSDISEIKEIPNEKYNYYNNYEIRIKIKKKRK